MKLIHCFSLLFIPFFSKAQSSSLPTEIPIDQKASITIKLQGYPDFLAADEDGVWVTNDGRIEKLISGESLPVKIVSLPSPCGAMAIGFGSIWVASCSKKSLYRIDLLSGEVSSIIDTGLADEQGELSIAIGAGSVWLLTNVSGELSRIDPYKNKVARKIKVMPNSFAAAFGFNAVWITNTASGSVQKIDPKEEKVIATIPVGKTPRFLTAGAGAVWTLNQEDGTVSKIDPVTNKVVSTIVADAIGTGGDIATSDSKVYVRAKSPLLSVIDPNTNEVSTRYGPSAGSGAVRVENGRVWVTAHDINTIWILNE